MLTRSMVADWKADLKKWPSNLNAAAANVLITAPFIVSRLVFINKWVPEAYKMSYGLTFWSMILSYSMSFAIHGGGLIFKTFTSMQAFILILQIENYGINSLPVTVVGAGLVILFAVYTKLYDIMKFMPYCVLAGFQMSVGLSYILNEFINIMGVPNQARMGVNLVGLIDFFWNHSAEINFVVPLTVLTGSIVFHYLIVRHRKIPWHAILFIISIPISIVFRSYFESFPKKTVMEYTWPRDKEFPSHILDSRHWTTILAVVDLKVLTQPLFLLSILTLGILTMMESGMTMEGLHNYNNTSTIRSKELLGLGITNVLSGLVGLPPCSLSMCRTILMHQMGANSPVYKLLGVGFLILFTWLAFPITKYVPMILISFYNISLGFLLINVDTIWFYWKYNKKYAGVVLAMVGATFVLHIIFGLIITWLVFFAMYLSRVHNESFRFGIFREVKEKILKFSEQERIKYLEKGATLGPEEAEIIQGGQRLHAILDDIELNGLVYELHGRFNFAYYSSHVENIIQLKRDVILVDMSDIFDADIEFMSKYRDLFEGLLLTNSRIYVTGIPKRLVGDNLLWRNTWIETMDEQERILYKE